jgi:DNA-binding protein H-NS
MATAAFYYSLAGEIPPDGAPPREVPPGGVPAREPGHLVREAPAAKNGVPPGGNGYSLAALQSLQEAPQNELSDFAKAELSRRQEELTKYEELIRRQGELTRRQAESTRLNAEVLEARQAHLTRRKAEVLEARQAQVQARQARLEEAREGRAADGAPPHVEVQAGEAPAREGPAADGAPPAPAGYVNVVPRAGVGVGLGRLGLNALLFDRAPAREGPAADRAPPHVQAPEGDAPPGDRSQQPMSPLPMSPRTTLEQQWESSIAYLGSLL